MIKLSSHIINHTLNFSKNEDWFRIIQISKSFLNSQSKYEIYSRKSKLIMVKLSSNVINHILNFSKNKDWFRIVQASKLFLNSQSKYEINSRKLWPRPRPRLRMGGRLMQLIAYGVQDMYLTEAAEVPFFGAEYKDKMQDVYLTEAVEVPFFGAEYKKPN